MDAAEYLKKQTEILNLLTEIDTADLDSKREYIIRLIEVSRPIVENPRTLAMYINAKLLSNNITYPRNGEYFYNLFTEDEKLSWGTNFSSTIVEHIHKMVNTKDSRFKVCDCGLVEFQQIMYDVKEIEETESEISQSSEPVVIFNPHKHPMTEYFSMVADNCDKLKKIAEDLMFKFADRKEVADVITSKIPHPEFKIIEQKELQAKLMYLSKLTDFRNRIGSFEKLKAILLVQTTFLVAKVAKLLAITPKHTTNNIIKNKDEYIRDMKWFKQIHLNCKHCGSQNEYDIGDWYNEQLIRKKIGLTLEQPFS